jgi:hypothetical protein
MESNTLSSWDLFVLRHRHPGNLLVHFVSFVVYYGSVPLAIYFGNFYWLLGLPLSGVIGASGHYIFRDGGVKVSEATFDPQVVFYVTIMFLKIAQRRYRQDIICAEKKYAQIAS